MNVFVSLERHVRLFQNDISQRSIMSVKIHLSKARSSLRTFQSQILISIILFCHLGTEWDCSLEAGFDFIRSQRATFQMIITVLCLKGTVSLFQGWLRTFSSWELGAKMKV